MSPGELYSVGAGTRGFMFVAVPVGSMNGPKDERDARNSGRGEGITEMHRSTDIEAV